MSIAASSMRTEKLLLSLVLLLFASSLVVVNGRCMPSPTVEELFESEDYVIRAKIESNHDNSDGKICNSAQAQPVLATVLEVFKGSSAPEGFYPTVGDEVLLNYWTDTGFRKFGFYVNENLDWDSEGYMLFPTTGCDSTEDDDYQVFSINSCHSEGIKGWSSLSEDVKTMLRSTDEWRYEIEQEEEDARRTSGDNSTSGMRVPGDDPTTDTSTASTAATTTANDVTISTDSIQADCDNCDDITSSSSSIMIITVGVPTVLFIASLFVV